MPAGKTAAASDADADSRELDRAEELLVDILRLAGESVGTLARSLPPRTTASSESGADSAVEAAGKYQAKVRELQDILTRQSRHLVQTGGEIKPEKSTTYGDALDARLADADAFFLSETPAAKRKKRKRK